MTDILDYIPFGSKNAVGRTYLVAATGIDDRTIREMIRKASTPEHPVVSNSKGYFQPSYQDFDVVQSYYRQESARRRSVWKNCETIRAWLDAHRDEELAQMSIEDCMGG
ncbi:hypothetical protein [Shuttleworthella satelles]|nr:hypothetical protein [Shuttleworthia satelles]